VGLAKNENPNQGAFIIDELTDLVEEAVLKEFEAIAERGGVLGAMETGYQRGKIQEESLLLRAQEARRLLPDHRRQYLPQSAGRRVQIEIELARSTEDEKQSQFTRLRTSSSATHLPNWAVSTAMAPWPISNGPTARVASADERSIW
jgi:methylmalonyl-CoA mutase